jgi:DNA-binding transcriptional ArsR family regulator
VATALRLTEVEIPDASALGVRVVVSPALTLAMALMDALGGQPETPWRRLLRERARGLDSSPLMIFARPAFVLPNALLPLPACTPRAFEDELEALRASSTDLLLRDLPCCRWPGCEQLPAELAPFGADPAGALARYCDALAEHWDRMLRPSWPLMRRLLERELLMIGHTMLASGVAGVLESLHPQVSYGEGRLRYHTGAFTHASYVAQDAVMLAPIACEADLILVNEDHPDATVIGYPARGSAELWGAAQREPAAELSSLLGATRARIALAVAVPSTTSELAERLELAPSTVSRHLFGLLENGLADRTRRGPVVIYRLTARGTALLDLF